MFYFDHYFIEAERHIYTSVNWAIVGPFQPDNGLLPDQCQDIIWSKDELLLIAPLGIDYSEILIRVHTFSYKKMSLKTFSVK